MRSWMIAATISASLLATGGCCHMCQHPYENCGPIYSRGECTNCNPDYRAGSIVNRPTGSRMVAADRSRFEAAHAPAVRIAQRPQPRAIHTATAGRPKPARPIALETPRVLKAAPISARAAEPSADQKAQEEAAFAAKLPAGTIPAPPGTREGSTRVLSVTDKRLDEAPSEVADQKQPEPFAERPAASSEDWQPVTARRRDAAVEYR